MYTGAVYEFYIKQDGKKIRIASSRMKCNTKITNNGKTKRFDWCQVV